jgi:hypothetical protein
MEFLSPEVRNSANVEQYAANLSWVKDWMGFPNGPYYLKVSDFQTDCCHRFYTIPQN